MKEKKFTKKNIFFLIFFLFFLLDSAKSQTSIYIDNMESTGWTWKGIPKVLLNSYYTGGLSNPSDFPANSPLYSSSDSAFALFGVGLGSSAIEKDTLSYLNITGLNSGTYYQIRFKVCSIGINPSVNAAAGVDGSDYVQLEYSLNGGITFIKEMKFVGASNSMWGFSGGIQVTKTANGLLTTFTSSPTTTTLALNLPVGITQLAFNIIMANNASGESWLIDDVELLSITSLPIELLSFDVDNYENNIRIFWSTASEVNNDYFIIYKSDDAFSFNEIGRIDGYGNSNFINQYEFHDKNLQNGIYYYKLVQVDFDGTFKEYAPVSIRLNQIEPTLIKVYNLYGQEVDYDYPGIKFYYYSDQKILKKL